MLLAVFLPMTPVNAAGEATVVTIADQESISGAFIYAPVVNSTSLASMTPGNNVNYADNNSGVPYLVLVSGTGQIILTNKQSITLYNVNISLNPGNTGTWTIQSSSGATTPLLVSGGNSGSSVTNDLTDPINVTAQSLAAGGSITVTYGLSPSTAVPAFQLNSTYSQNYIVNNANSNTIVHLTAYANASGLPGGAKVTNPTIVISPAKSSGGTAEWTLSSTSSGVTSSGGSLTWSPSGSFSAGTVIGTADMTVQDNDVTDLASGGNNVSLLNMTYANVSYTVTGGTASSAGVSVNTCTAATTEVTSSVTKQFTNNQWVFTPQVSVPATSNITYSLTSVSEWAVNSSNLNSNIATQTVNSGHSNGEFPVALQGNGTKSSWTGSGSTYELMQFMFNGIPVGFVKPNVNVQYDTTQFPLTTSTGANWYNVTHQIFVINGYLVSATKNISSTTPGSYLINITVQNLGTQATPPHVFVYDIIPQNFWTSFGSPLLNGIASTPHTQQLASGDYAVYWDIGQLAAQGQTGDHDYITYTLTGSGIYNEANLYVVGVDPAQSVNWQTSPLISNAATIVNANYESLAALGALGLVLVGMIGTARRRL